MEETELYILGHPIKIRYHIHDRGYVQWKLVPAVERWEGEHDLLDLLLRMHCNQLIEAMCREDSYYTAYTAEICTPDTEIDPDDIRSGLNLGSVVWANIPHNPKEEDIPF